MSDRLSSIESIMWRAGHDPTLRMTIGNLILLDGPPEREALIDRLHEAALRVPRLSWRVDDPQRGRSRPVWAATADFDAGDHVRTMGLPLPGTRQQLLDLLELVEAAPFDPDRSPWDVTLVEGLEGGKAALYLRAHHVLSDGMGGVSLTALLFDEATRIRGEVATIASPLAGTAESADVEPPETDGEEIGPEDTATADVSEVGVASADRRPGRVTLTVDLASAARPVAAGVSAAMRLDPLDAAVRNLQRGLDVANSLSRQVIVTGGRLSPLPSGRSANSRFEVVSVPGCRAAARQLGGSRNDLLVAAAAIGLGRYHERLGLACPELRLATPASLHRDGGAGGNWFAPTRLEVPTAGEHPGPRFGVIQERLARARREPAVPLAGTLASAVNRLPERLLLPALQAQANSVDFVATAIPGVRGARHICGATVEQSYPFGPRLGRLVNLTGFGNDDRLDIGIALDPVAIIDPEMFLECLLGAFAGFGPKVAPSARAPRAGRR